MQARNQLIPVKLRMKRRNLRHQVSNEFGAGALDDARNVVEGFVRVELRALSAGVR